ncbi:MAG: sigma-70 family RNA polymerase sigma factor [Chitinophagaceae bacterium]|nr:sigma-70 family RNA polymerase sigma factor [Chitinophagaceae bacterium]
MLLHALSNNNQNAFEQLFNRYKNKIYGVAHKFTHCVITSEEIVQEVFMIVWLKRSEFSKVENFEAYILTITKHLVYKFLREKARQSINSASPVATYSSVHHAEIQLRDKEYSQILRQAVKKLPLQQQKVYMLIKENGLKRNEVAKMLQLTPDTIKFHLAQAMKSIRIHCMMYLNTLFFPFSALMVDNLILFDFF